MSGDPLRTLSQQHEIARDDIRYVIRHCGLAFDAPPPPGSPYTEDRVLIIGDTPTGVAIDPGNRVGQR